MSPQSSKIKGVKRPDSLSAQVTAGLENFIIKQQLKQGERLPTERELAEKFNVSRTVIREAVRSLVANGVLQVNPGSGTIIKRPTASIVTRAMSHYLRLGEGGLDHEKITEVRRLLEVEIAGLAAQRRTPGDIERLRAILADFERVTGDKVAFSRWDVSFHLQIAAATQNQLLRLLLDSISGIMTKVREIGFDIPGSSERAFRRHGAILATIEAGDVNGARQAMLDHIEDSERIMAEAMSARQTKGANPPPAS